MAEELDPNTIKILPRQRIELGNIEELQQSISEIGQIQAIICRHEKDTNHPILMVGGRRLTACKNLKISVKVDWYETLSETQAKIVELEENVKRLDLTWREHVRSVGEIHNLLIQTEPNWTFEQTRKKVSLNKAQFSKILTVYKNLDNPILKNSDGIKQSFSILQESAERKASNIVRDIIQVVSGFATRPPASSTETNETPTNPDLEIRLSTGEGISIPETNIIPWEKQPKSQESKDEGGEAPNGIIITADFTEWIKSYTGKKFNLIHCDFPYGLQYERYASSVTSTAEDYDFQTFETLTEAFCENIDKVLSYSAHILFWFSMKFYQKTKSQLESAKVTTGSNLYVHEHPLIWLKSDNAGIIPGRNNLYPRRIYETAFLCSTNKRPLVKSLSNAYAAPTATNPVHPSQKPEPVLRFFFNMLVDETTDMLDPTCGSGTSIRAAEDCGARSALGIEINEDYAQTARTLTENHRTLKLARGER